MQSISINLSITESIKGLYSEADSVALESASLKIESDAQYLKAAEITKRLRLISKSLVEARGELTAPIDSARKEIMDFFRGPESRIASAQRTIDCGIRDYQVARENERKEAEKKALAEAAAKLKANIAKLEARAKKAEETGKVEKADELREMAEIAHVPAVAVHVEVPKVAGISFRSVWSAKIVDFKAIPQETYLSDPKVQAAIASVMGSYAKASKGGLKIPGV
jgi:hypothetical protein